MFHFPLQHNTFLWKQLQYAELNMDNIQIFHSSKTSAETYLSNHTVVEAFAEAPELLSVTHFCLCDINKYERVKGEIHCE